MPRTSLLVPALLALVPLRAAEPARFPADRAGGVNPDTHLTLTFAAAPALGHSGLIRIYDTADHRLVDTLDLGIPAGPDPAGPRAPSQTHSPNEPALPRPDVFAPGHPTNANTVAGTAPGQPDAPQGYQLTIIGGVTQGFHFHPVIIRGNTATIYPHNNLLDYHHTYAVELDPGVLTGGGFAGIGPGGWTFSTKEAPPPAGAARVVVAADGSGDFNTVQGALDWAPDHPARRVTIFIRNGTYEEIVFFHDKADLTLQGESRDGVQIGYGNNSVFNGPAPKPGGGFYARGGPSRRCAFAAYNCTGLVFSDLSVSNYLKGQAEGLLLSGERNLVRRVNITGSGDALNLRGSAYFVDSRIVGDGDTILGLGPAFFRHCELSSWGAYMWIRNPRGNHGNVFVDCTFKPPSTPRRLGRNSDPVLARLPNNHGVNYPYAEAVLIDCRLQGIPPQGWGPIDDDTSHLHLWEYHSTNLADGQPVDVSRRHPVSKQLHLPQDAQILAQYRDPAFVLGGWNPATSR